MKTIILSLFVLLTGNILFSQSEKELAIPLVEASYTGGPEAMQAYLSQNLVIPKNKKNIQGKIYVEFTVDREGNVKDVKVLRGIDPDLDRLAAAAIAGMPAWKPAVDASGAPMASKMILPISFRH